MEPPNLWARLICSSASVRYGSVDETLFSLRSSELESDVRKMTRRGESLQRRLMRTIAFKLKATLDSAERSRQWPPGISKSLCCDQITSMRLVFNLPELRTAPARAPHLTSRHVVGCIRRRTRWAMAGLVMTWCIICGLVLLAILMGWKL